MNLPPQLMIDALLVDTIIFIAETTIGDAGKPQVIGDNNRMYKRYIIFNFNCSAHPPRK